MAENSKIEWTHHTFNPWIGCTKVSAACDNCYAEAWDARFKGNRWGPKADRTRTKTWGNPVKWNRKAEAEGTRYRVFCASLADVFDNHKSILPEWRIELWALIKATPHLDWLLLTKRPQNIERYLPDDWGNGYQNVWLGTTVEDQTEANRRIPHLITVPAAIHFLSCEPLLGKIDLTKVYMNEVIFESGPANCLSGQYFSPWGFAGGVGNFKGPKIDWVIVGGENHKDHRDMEIDWLRDLRDQCAANGTAFLFKQWSGNGQKEIKAMGRELDGIIHDGYPTPETF